MRCGYGHMLVDEMVVRLRGMRAERRARLDALGSPQEALVYQENVRAAVRDAFGPWPERTSLKTTITGRLESPEFTVEKLHFESRPGCLVTANLYLPRGLQEPAPCVLGTCGHATEGKGYELYQAFCQRLALNGFVVLIYDPINQGERDQYAGLQEREAVRACTSAHNMMGKQQELVGDYFGMWRAWDGIRALDYLLSRPEVDSTRVGLTGNSGGGTLSTWLWALDERYTMVAPGCFVITFMANLENELPADCEQYPPGVLGRGLEMADFIIAGAPKPALLLGQHYDFFDRRGLDEATDDIERFYHLLGAPDDHVAMFRGPHGHGYYVENQEQMVSFFCKHASMPYRPTEVELFGPSDLDATPTGEVIAAGGKPVYRFTAEAAARMQRERPEFSSQELVEAAFGLLGIDCLPRAPHYRNLRATAVDGLRCSRHAVETEGSVRAILYKTMVDNPLVESLDVGEKALLYIPHLSSEQDLPALVKRCEGESAEVYALDARGLGETRPDEEGSFWQPYGMDYMMHGHELLFGRSYLGRRVWDTLCAIALLCAEGAQHVSIEGRGQGAIIALFAALLDDRVEQVTLRNGPSSYREWTETPLVLWPAANILRSVLQHFDLDDCVSALGERAIVIEPWDALMQLVE